MRNGLIFEFRSKFGKTIFFALKNTFWAFYVGSTLMTCLFYGLNLRDLSQTFRIWCENPFSDLLPQLDWPRLKKAKKFQKMPFLGLYLCWWSHMLKIVINFVWQEFRGILLQNLLKKFNFRFFIFSPVFSKKNLRTPKSTFLESDSCLDDFSIKF